MPVVGRILKKDEPDKTSMEFHNVVLLFFYSIVLYDLFNVSINSSDIH